MIDWVSANLPEIVAALLVWNGILSLLFLGPKLPSADWVKGIASQVTALQNAVVTELENVGVAFEERDKKAEEIERAMTELKRTITEIEKKLTSLESDIVHLRAQGQPNRFGAPYFLD